MTRMSSLAVFGSVILVFFIILASTGSDATRASIIPVLGWLFGWVLGSVVSIAVLVWIIATGVRYGLAAHARESNGGAQNPHTALLPDADSEPATPADGDGRGRYTVQGVNRESKTDTTWRGTADSAANTKVKAELEGVIVTHIQRDG